MKHLHCTTCKFTLPVTAAETESYKASIPMHCGVPMIPDGEGLPAPAVTPAETPTAKAEAKAEEPKKEKKGFFGKKKKG